MQLNTTEQFGLKCCVTFEWRLCSWPLSARPTQLHVVSAQPDGPVPTQQAIGSAKVPHGSLLPIARQCHLSIHAVPLVTDGWLVALAQHDAAHQVGPCGAGAVRSPRQRHSFSASLVTCQWLMTLDGWTPWTDVANESTWRLQHHMGWPDGLLSQADATARVARLLVVYKPKLQTKQQPAGMAR